MTDAQDKTDAGFTLLELMIALTIFALIMVALADGVHFAGRAWRSQENGNVQQGDIHAVQGVLRQMIASGREFKGDGGSLRFVGTLPAALGRGGLYDIELDAYGDKFALSWKPHFKGPSARLQQNDSVLLEGIVTADFSYFIEQQGWQHSLSGRSKPLQLIAIRAQLLNGRNWPPLIVTPLLDIPDKPKS